MKRRERLRDEYAIVLDYLKHGYSEDSRPFHMKEPIVQAIGNKYFTLLELVPKQGIELQPNDNVYIGEKERDKINYIKGKLDFSKLTPTAKNMLKDIIEKLVAENEEKFVNFFNNCGSISLRSHQLDLLPGIGTKHRDEIIRERGIRKFENFDDVKNRVSAISNPKQIIVNRILAELEGKKDRYKLFIGGYA